MSEQVIEMAERIAPSDASVLITGNSGTGKEVFAHFIHKQSRRADGPFVALNCAAIPENLLESELFGHEKGAFSGAISRRIGKFEEASGGTLLLDEISEMDFRLQAKLLRALQEREIDRLGGSSPVKIDVRILATSNRQMEDYVNEGKFREDLYFRLNVVNLQLPNLSKRPADIPLLCEYFIEKYSKSNGIEVKKMNQGALDKLLTHHWPGNVRELENVMHLSVLLARGDVISEHDITFKKALHRKDDPSFVARTLTDVERDHIMNTLSYCDGDHNDAAHLLGMSLNALRGRLENYSNQGLNTSQKAL
ncbi:MAG: sigma-54 dependent transcriptional regulator [Pseudomonadota bacterium]